MNWIDCVNFRMNWFQWIIDPFLRLQSYYQPKIPIARTFQSYRAKNDHKTTVKINWITLSASAAADHQLFILLVEAWNSSYNAILIARVIRVGEPSSFLGKQTHQAYALTHFDVCLMVNVPLVGNLRNTASPPGPNAHRVKYIYH